MSFNDAALVVAANAISGVITHLQLHSAASGPGYTTNLAGTRVSANAFKTVDADGDIIWTNVPFTGLTANQTVAEVSYWSASSGGTNYGGATRNSGDTTANSSGEYTLTSLTETSSAT